MPDHDQKLIYELNLSKYRLYYLASLIIKLISDIPELNNIIHKVTFACL